MIDGILKEFTEIIKEKEPMYKNNVQLIQEALMIGLEQMKDKNDN